MAIIFQLCDLVEIMVNHKGVLLYNLRINGVTKDIELNVDCKRNFVQVA